MQNSSPFETRTPQPAKPRTKIRLIGDELHLTWKNPGAWGAAFLIFWLAGWTAGCVMLLHKLVTEFEWFLMLFATPFFAAWFAVSGLVIFILFGRQRLIIGRNHVRCFSKALITYHRRKIPLDEVARAATDTKIEKNSDGPSRVLGIITLSTLGLPIHFAKGIKDDEADWLAETINTCLDRLAPNRRALAAVDALHASATDEEPRDSAYDSFASSFPSETANQFDESFEDEYHDQYDEPFEDDKPQPVASVLVFEPGRDRQKQPSDSRWRLDRSGRSVQLAIRGKWKAGEIAGILFFNLFWNGIVGVFVYQVVVEFQWFLAVFLIPFVLIGLLMMLALTASLTAPLWGMRYSFRLGEIRRRYWGPLFATNRLWEFTKLNRLEIRKRRFKSSSQEIPPKRFTDGSYQLALIDSDEHLLTTIDAITRGEALWMADTLMNERPEMFERR